MRATDELARRVAATDSVVCISGETGAGKAVLARRIHQLSPRCSGPFIGFNCAAVHPAITEEELFGHDQSHFPGRFARMVGRLQAADGGTLFLDDVGELPAGAQQKLLRFLDDRRFRYSAGIVKSTTDVRLIVATCRPIAHETSAGSFCEDLCAQFEGVAIHVPPLRERREDVVPLFRRLLIESASKHGVAVPRMQRATLAAIEEHAWPGNVRELRNVAERLAIVRGGRRARIADLPEALRARLQAHAPRAPQQKLVY